MDEKFEVYVKNKKTGVITKVITRRDMERNRKITSSWVSQLIQRDRVKTIVYNKKKMFIDEDSFIKYNKQLKERLGF